MIELRPYQQEALNALEYDWTEGLQRLGVSAATGTGKTVIMSRLAHNHVKCGHRVLILVHREELIRQTVDKLLRVDRSVSIGVVKAGENRGSAAIVVASVQTISRPRRLAQIGQFGLIICDEAHRSMSDQWMKPLVALGATTDGGPRVAGFSATWTRADRRSLGDFWQKISFELSTEWAITQGFLVKPIGKYIKTDIRLEGIKKTAGDYNDRALAAKLSRESIRNAIVAGYLRFARDRSGVVFAPTVDTAEFFREGFEAAGITTGGLYGTTGREDSARLHKQHRNGDVQVLMSCTRLSEGWDAPWCSAAVIARPTTHQGLFVQMVGRILRPHDESGKTDAIILDPTGVLFKHKLAGVIDLSESDTPDEETERVQREHDELSLGGSAAPTYHGDVSGFEDVPLFAESEAVWLRTARGTRFVYAKGEIMFLVDAGDTWHVGICQSDNVSAGRWMATHATLEQAERIASGWALSRDPLHCTPGLHWRQRKASPQQRTLALAHGLRSGFSRSGEAYDNIARVVATRTLDTVASWV